MARRRPEWIAETPDRAIPARVLDRICKRHDDRCQGSCGQKFGGKLRAQADHIVALINGGENRESNIQPLCQFCHQLKTKIDVKEKARTYRKRKHILGIKKPTGFRGWRLFDGTAKWANNKDSRT